MGAQDTTAQRDAERVRGPGGLDAVVDLGLREQADEPLVGRGEEHREAEAQQIVGVSVPTIYPRTTGWSFSLNFNLL